MESCLYHADKSVFDQVQKELHRTAWIPRQHGHRLAMAVCSCRKFKCPVDAWVIIRMYHDYLLELLIQDVDSTIPRSLRQMLSDCLNRVASGNMDYSACRFVTILYKAKYNDFTLLQRENVSSNKMDKGPLGNKKPAEKRQKLTKDQIECMKRKRQKKYTSMMATLHMFPGNKTKMEQHLKENLFDFSKNNRCYVDFPHDLNNRSYENNVKVTYVKIWSKDTAGIRSVHNKLQVAAESAQKVMDEQRTARQNKKAVRKLMAEQEKKYRDRSPEDPLEKELLSDDYEKKYMKDKKCHSKKPSNPVLLGGHCLQCFKPFTGLSDKTQCTYHSGFLDVDCVWSCCAKTYDEKYPDMDYDMHSETGCTTCVTHMWRPNSKRYRTSSKKVTYIDRQYARTRHIKHRYDRHAAK